MTSAFFKASRNVPVSMALLIIPAIVTDITGLAILMSFGGILSEPVAFFGFSECKILATSFSFVCLKERL